MNIKSNYFIVQGINIIFTFLSYLFVKNYLNVSDQPTLSQFLVLLSVVLGGVYVFFTNRLFNIWLKNTFP